MWFPLGGPGRTRDPARSPRVRCSQTLLVDFLLSAVIRSCIYSLPFDSLCLCPLPPSASYRGLWVLQLGPATPGGPGLPAALLLSCAEVSAASSQFHAVYPWVGGGVQSWEPKCVKGSWMSAVALSSVGVCPGQQSPGSFLTRAGRAGARASLHWFESPERGLPPVTGCTGEGTLLGPGHTVLDPTAAIKALWLVARGLILCPASYHDADISLVFFFLS